jgi:hypothetical protein
MGDIEVGSFLLQDYPNLEQSLHGSGIGIKKEDGG